MAGNGFAACGEVYEIVEFIREGREDYIIPFIVGGEVNASDPAKECFPPALRELVSKTELRGADVATNGKQHALVDVVATMLGVRRDLLWNRYKIRQRKQRIAMCAAAIFAILCALFYWDYTRPTYQYFADYVDVWGAPKGIIELDKEQVKHRNHSYRFEMRRIPIGQPNAYSWRLAKVANINSAGNPKEITETAFNDRYPVTELVYHPENGSLTDIIYCDTKGKKQLSHKLSNYNGVAAAIVDIESTVAGEATTFAKNITNIGSDNNDRKSRITRYAYSRNEDGYITKVTYHANNDVNLERSAVADNNAVWGIAYELDSLGRRIRVQYLNKDGSYFSNNIGVSARCYQYDNNGNMLIETSVDINGNPILDEYLVAKYIAKYDERGNQTETSFYGIDGNLCLCNYGYAKWGAKYDERGNEIERSFYGIDGNPCLSKEGIAKWVSKYDDRGNVIERSYYGINGKPCLINDGYAKCVSKYDERGNRTEVSFYGIDGNPCLSKEGIAKSVSKYDDRGNVIERSFYGIDGNLCLCDYGCAKITAQYDDRGNQIATFCYGVDGELCLNIYGYSIQIIECNDRCLVTELSYYDTERKPVNARGYFKEVRIYDKNNNVKETVYYDKEGKQLAEQIYTRQISDVSSAALAQGVPIGSIVLQFNEWRIGDTQASLLQIERRDKYNEKSVYYLSPTGKIGHLYVKGGLMGISLYDFMVEKNHAQKWLEQLNEWIKNKNN